MNPQPSIEETGIFTAAAGSGHDKIVREFLDKYPHAVDARDRWGNTALQLAAQHGRTKMAQMLLEMGADIKKRGGREGRAALLCAVYAGHHGTAKALLEKGADIEMPDIMGRTPLIWASINNHWDIVQLLLEKGADINARDDVGNTALMFAQAWEKAEATTLLRQWPEKERQRLAEKEARELAADIADFSPALRRDMPAPRPLKFPRKGQ